MQPIGGMKIVLYQGNVPMPIQIKYRDNGLGVLFIGAGIVTGEDIINSNREIFSSAEKMKNYKYSLIDYLNISGFNVSNAEIQIIISQDKKASELIPDAVIAITAKKDLEFGVSRMWEIIAENESLQWEIMVFKDREKAELWIKDRIKEKFNIDISIQ